MIRDWCYIQFNRTHQRNDEDDEEDCTEVSLLGHWVPLTEVRHALLGLGLPRGGEDEQIRDRGDQGEQPRGQDKPENGETEWE